MILSRRFYSEAVKPIIDKHFGQLAYSAGLMDYGSDVLGFDDRVSTDHQWGPRLSIFLKPEDLSPVGKELDLALSTYLPCDFRGFPTNFSGTRSDYIRHMEPAQDGYVKHIIRIHTAEEFFSQHLGIDIHQPISTLDWLLFPQQRLATLRKGQLFHDGLNLSRLKDGLEYYPKDVWYYLMSTEWGKIAAEESFVGRCGDVGDELGSRILAARLVHRLMTLYFLQQREYIPYSKWFGSAFNRLAKPAALDDALRQVLTAPDWRSREKSLATAYTLLATAHNTLGLTEPLDTGTQRYHGREYVVLMAGRFSDALHAIISSPALRSFGRLGNIDQISDHSAILTDIDVAKKAIHLYGHESGHDD